MKRIIAVIVSLVLISMVFFCAVPVIGNLWSLSTGQGFFIPQESSVFSFKVLQMNTGSGEWWIYAEDRKNYYFAGDLDKPVKYALFPKANVADCVNFNPTNYSTWCQEYTDKIK
jgi:hypothetical protein